MMASRILTRSVAFGLGVVLGCGWAQSSDPLLEPRPIAAAVRAFEAPAEPPPDAVSGESPAPEPAAPLTLRDALALALMRNPDLAAFSWEVRSSEARALQAGATPNPELDVRVYRLGIPTQDARVDEERTRVVLSHVLELGGKRSRRVDLAQTERDLASWDYEEKRLEVAAAVTRRFVEVLGAQRRVASWSRHVEFFEEMRDRVSGLVEAGAMRSVEIHQITRRVGLARIELKRAESELSAARFGLAGTWGGRSPRFTEAVGDLGNVKPIPDIQTVIDLAEQSPTIARWDAELAKGEAALALARARRVPDLTYGVGVRWENDWDQRDYLVDLEISLPIFDRKQGEILEARYDMARVRASRKTAETASGESIAEVYYRLAESVSRGLTLDEEVVPAARATVEAFRRGFERELANLGDLLDARRDLARAEVQYTDALVDYHRTLATLEGLVGQSLTAAD